MELKTRQAPESEPLPRISLRAQPGSTPLTIALVAIGVVALLLIWAFPQRLAFGWVPVLLAIFGIPAIGLARMLGVGHTIGEQLMLGLPAAAGLQFVVFVAAAVVHLPPTVWGTIAIGVGLAVAVAEIWYSRAGPRSRVDRINLWVVLGLLVMIAVGSTTVFLSGRDGDDWSYAAYVADYAEDRRLSDTHPTLGNELPMDGRSRFNLWIAVLGLGSRASSLPVFDLLQVHLPPVLAAIALLATFLLGRAIGRSSIWGLLAVAVALAWFAVTPQWFLPGDNFLHRMSQDKAVALLIFWPLVLIPLVERRQWPLWRVSVFFVLGGLGLSGIHAGIYTMGFLVVATWLIADYLISRHPWRSDATIVASFSVALVFSVLVLSALSASGPESGSAVAVELERVHVQNVTTTERIVVVDDRVVTVDPRLVSDPLTLILLGLGLVTPFLVHTRGATLIGVSSAIPLLIAFNPLLTPHLGEALIGILGLGQLVRFTWILPMPFVLVALLGGLEPRLGRRSWIAAGVVLLAIAALQAGSFDEAVDSWTERRRAYDGSGRVVEASGIDLEELEPIYDVLRREAAFGERVMAPGAVAARLGGNVPDIVLISFRGRLGDVPHYPAELAGYGWARAQGHRTFYRGSPDVFSNADLEYLRSHNVHWLVVESDDARVEEVSGLIGEGTPGGRWTLYPIDELAG